ncbi:TPA: hypothetical protein OUJ77_000634 [Klebsiella aerogenes]|nr:hypothetical protein [Klebsiella aerogenes]
MTDTNYLVSMPASPFSTPRAFKSVANGRIYIAIPDTDPVNPANQIPVYIVNEDGSEVQVSQPVVINAGGFPVYNGQIAKFVVKQNYSMAVYDSVGVQQYYWPDLSTVDPSNLLVNLTSDNGASLIGTEGGDSLQVELFKQKQGTSSLRDSATPGTMDVLLNSTTPGTVELRKTKTVMPNSSLYAQRWFRNRGISSPDDSVTNFELTGQGFASTIIKHPATTQTGRGDHIYMDYLKRVKIGGMTLDNSEMGMGTSQATSKNGQIWLRYAEDSHVDDIKFIGGDVLSYTLDNCKNIYSTNLKVDYQFRYPSGYSKSPLIVGDFSEKCMFVGGYVRSISHDGSVIYAGDLADNDQANDTKWAFINLLGLPYTTRANANACMWQEGEDAPSNAHFIGMNYYGNGIGHGISQQAVGTDIGCTVREAQVRGAWNTSRYCSIGGHWIDNKGENTAGVANSAALGGIHSDNGRWTNSMGEYFSGNLRDAQDYTGGAAHAFNSIHLTGNRHASPIVLGSGGNAIHLGVVNSQLATGATIFSGNNRGHASIVSNHIVGILGTFGNGSAQTVTDVIGCTMISDGATEAMVSQSGLGVVNFNRCVIRDYTAGLVSDGSVTPANVTFEKVTFVGVSFTSTDLMAKYIACAFVNCTNAPNTLGLNFSADSFSRPSTARCEVTVSAGGTYTFPSWIMETRGVYNIKIGGRGSDLSCAEFRISKGTASNNGTVTAIFESTSGKFTITWASGAMPVITFNDAGSYTVKIG